MSALNRAPVSLTALRIAAAAAAATLGSGCGSTDNRPPAWGYIAPVILEPNCATSSCHGRAAAVAGLDFSDPGRAYTSLTQLWVWIVDPQGTADQGCKPMDGKVFCQRPHRPLVTAFDPAESRLVNMLRAHDAPRMPPDRPLAEADIRLVERWILNGALQGPPGADAGGRASVDGAGADVSADARPAPAGPPDATSNADAPTDSSLDAAGDAGLDFDARVRADGGVEGPDSARG